MHPVQSVFIRLSVAGLLVVFLAAFSADGLEPLVLDGHELHPSLTTPRIDDRPTRHVSRDVLLANPQLSSDEAFIRAIASSGSQGNLGGEGIVAALYALYVGEKDVGLYGLQAASTEDADRLERALREIWSHNVSIDRAQIHRAGRVLVIVWTDGLAPEAWEAVNEMVDKRLKTY